MSSLISTRCRDDMASLRFAAAGHSVVSAHTPTVSRTGSSPCSTRDPSSPAASSVRVGCSPCAYPERRQIISEAIGWNVNRYSASSWNELVSDEDEDGENILHEIHVNRNENDEDDDAERHSCHGNKWIGDGVGEMCNRRVPLPRRERTRRRAEQALLRRGRVKEGAEEFEMRCFGGTHTSGSSVCLRNMRLPLPPGAAAR